jgi:preprotein translocase subunit YajC
MDASLDLTCLNWMVAQTAPPLTNSGAATTGQPGGAQTPGAAPGTGATGGGGAAPGGGTMLLLFGVMGAVLLFSILGSRRETKRKQAMLEALKKNDRVQTVGGIIGSIIEIKPDVVVLKVDENSNTRVTFARSAVVGVVKEAAPEASQQVTQR